MHQGARNNNFQNIRLRRIPDHDFNKCSNLSSIQRELFLPQIQNRHPTFPKEYSDKDIISKEWDNIDKIKQRGGLNVSKYNPLPPINSKHAKKYIVESKAIHNTFEPTPPSDIVNGNQRNSHRKYYQKHADVKNKQTSSERKKKENYSKTKASQHPAYFKNDKEDNGNVYNKDEDDCKTDVDKDDKNNDDESPITSNDSTQNKRKRNSNNLATTDLSQDTNEDNKTNSEENKEVEEKALPTLPKTPFSPFRKSRDYYAEEQTYMDGILKWARAKGRRNAICVEMDPLYVDLAVVMKEKLLIQHLEQIWMC